MTNRWLNVALCALTFIIIPPGNQDADAQAWVMPRGSGAISVMHQRLYNTAHRRIDGYVDEIGQSTNAAIYLEGEYALTDRLSVAAGIPFVFSKVTAKTAPRYPIQPPEWDKCHCWNSAFQDFGFTLRYNIMNGAFALTPSVSYGQPSHDYEFYGEAVPGRRLKEVRFAVDAGQRLDVLSEKLSVQGRYSYAVVERPIDIPINRSNASGQVAYAFTRKLSAYGVVFWQRTHGGLTFGSPASGAEIPWPGEVNTPERVAQHDRIMRDNYWHVGFGASYGFEKFDVFASYTAYVAGTDTHAGYGYNVGVSIPFELHLGH